MASVIKKLLSIAEQEADDTELWMLPYSTLMLMLVIMFIAFYAYSAFNSLEYEAAIADMAATKSDNSKSSNIKKEVAFARNMREFIADKQLSDKAQVIISAQFIKLKMESPALFDSGSAELKAESVPLLEKMLEQIKQMGNTIIVEGHTDNVPMHSQHYNSNWELSAARAFSVIRFFISNGTDSKRLVAHGFGEFRPVSSNDTELGRAKNRRIEITILREGFKG